MICSWVLAIAQLCSLYSLAQAQLAKTKLAKAKLANAKLAKAKLAKAKLPSKTLIMVCGLGSIL